MRSIRFLLIAVTLLVPAAIFGQVLPTASLAGTITDPSGFAVPGANVRLVNIATQVSKTVTSDTQGRYQHLRCYVDQANVRAGYGKSRWVCNRSGERGGRENLTEDCSRHKKGNRNQQEAN